MTGSVVETPQAERLLRRIKAEFLEMPGLRLTPRQATRLWALSAEECEALFRALTDAGFLVRADDGSFLRRSRS